MLKSLIAKDENIMFGGYTIRGTRISVVVIKGMYKAGDSIESLMIIFELSKEQILAAINFRNGKK